MSIQIEIVGRRNYLVGNTYPVRERIKAAGGHWDAERRAWWVGQRDKAEQLAAITPPSAAPSGASVYDGEVLGKATYKGRTYYVRWSGRTSKGTDAMHLVTLDGRVDFWADAASTQWVKRYERRPSMRGSREGEYPTLAGIRRFIAREQRETARTGESCWACRQHCTCAQGFCAHHHDGCDICGREC